MTKPINKATKTAKLWFDHNPNFNAFKMAILIKVKNQTQLADEILSCLEDNAPDLENTMWGDVLQDFIESIDYDHIADHWINSRYQ